MKANPKVCVVIPAYGNDSWIEAAKSVPEPYGVFVCFNDQRKFIPSSQAVSIGREVSFVYPEVGHYETGALKEAYDKAPGYDYYLLMHDSCVLKEDGIARFLHLMSIGMEAVAWITFAMQFDSPMQQEWVFNHLRGRDFLRDGECSEGIFGSIFMVSRKALTKLFEKDMFPPLPVNKEQSCGSERLWPIVFTAMGIPWTAMHPFEWGNERIRQDGYVAITKVLQGRQ